MRRSQPLSAATLYLCVLSACLLTSTRAWAYAQDIVVFLSDSRTASIVTATIEATDAATGLSYSDWEAVTGSLPGTSSGTKYRSEMSLFSSAPNNDLQEWFYGTGLYSPSYNYSSVTISPSYWSTTFTNVRVTVRVYINGYCHEDYEDISSWSGNAYLYFNGNGATLQGDCYRGNMLRTTP